MLTIIEGLRKTLTILDSTHDNRCGECSQVGVAFYLAVHAEEEVLVSQLCEEHLVEFLKNAREKGSAAAAASLREKGEVVSVATCSAASGLS